MIKFYVLTDDLLYKKQIENTIGKIIEPDNYTISNSIENINSENNNIYIVDLECVKKIDELCVLEKSGHIIVITSKKTELDIYSYQLENFTLIDKEDNYLEKLENSILNYLDGNNSFNVKIDNDNNHLRIALDEISSIKEENGKSIINVVKKNGKKYTYIFIFKPNDVTNLKEFIFNVKSNNLKLYYGSSYIIICDEKKGHKIYSNDLKNSIISLYLKGVSINYLSKRYGISTSAIYNWVKKYKLENKLKELENNNIKYKKIEEIVNSK